MNFNSCTPIGKLWRRQMDSETSGNCSEQSARVCRAESTVCLWLSVPPSKFRGSPDLGSQTDPLDSRLHCASCSPNLSFRKPWPFGPSFSSLLNTVPSILLPIQEGSLQFTHLQDLAALRKHPGLRRHRVGWGYPRGRKTFW